jgi:hypothetical protein
MWLNKARRKIKMNQIIRKTKENVWVVKQKNKQGELSEFSIRIIESGFPEKWIAIYEDAYGKLKAKRLTSAKILSLYGFLPE